MKIDGFAVVTALIGLVLLVSSVVKFVSASGCDDSYLLYPDNPFSSPVVELTYEKCESDSFGSLRALSAAGAGVGGACRQLEKCRDSIFAWKRFPYIQVFLAGCFFVMAYGSVSSKES